MKDDIGGLIYWYIELTYNPTSLTSHSMAATGLSVLRERTTCLSAMSSTAI